MTKEKRAILSLEEWPKRVESLLQWAGNRRVWCFYGDLGAGKTTAIQFFCRALGVITPVVSPTYSLVNTYEGSVEKTIYHLDLYRLASVEEGLEIGCEEYLASKHYAFVEWSERVKQLLPSFRMELYLTPIDSATREIKILRCGNE